MRMNRRRDIILTSLKFHKSAGDVSEVFVEFLIVCTRARELVSFDPWHVTRSPPIGKRI